MKLATRRSRLVLGAGIVTAAVLVVAVAALLGSNDDSSATQTVKRVGLMHVGTDHVPPSLTTLVGQLEARFGWDLPDADVKRCLDEKAKHCDLRGENIELMWRNLEPGEADAQARVFVGTGVDLIVAFEDKSIQAAQSATARDRNQIPIVFLHPSDPVRDGLVKSLDRPGGNITGVFGARDVVTKQLELYEELVPRLHRVLTLVDPTDARTADLLEQYTSAAAGLNRPLELDVRNASNAKDLKRIFRTLRPGQDDGAFVLSSNLRLYYSALILQLAKRAGLPVQAHRKEWVEQGALFSFGSDLRPIGRAAARYVDAILRGTAPADLAVQEIPDVEFAINLETASRLGIKVPQDTIISADEVYR
jgi:putative ABC transport system substrate-binding protein